MPLKTRELIHLVSNNILTDESTSISENLTYLHHDPSMYIKLNHKIDTNHVKSSNWQNIGEKQSILGQTGPNFLYASRLILYV